jgi:hypothetical protein
VRDDLRRGSTTLFSRVASVGAPLDELTARLLHMSSRVSGRMDRMPHGSPALKRLLRMSWQSLIVMAVAQAEAFFTPRFATEMERRSPFRFEFLRARQKRLAGRRGLYTNLFEVFLEPSGSGQPEPSCNLSSAALANI